MKRPPRREPDPDELDDDEEGDAEVIETDEPEDRFAYPEDDAEPEALRVVGRDA
jgi:hypothetical protein